jgi:membrane-bound lytic murein transglycosylase D
MAKNPEQYGLTDLTPLPPVLSDTVTTNYAISLPLVADLTGSTVQDIVALNPAMLRLSTPPDRPYDLHIPPGTADIFQTRLKDFPEENRVSWRFHVVKAGETLDQIAENLHARPAQLAEFNDVTPSQPLEAGDELIVPIAASAATSGQTHYTTRRTDTLVTVADRFGVTVQQLRAWNHLSSSRITPGRTLNVAEPVRMAPSTRRGRRGSQGSRGSHTASGTKAGTKSGTATRGKSHSGSQSSSHTTTPRSSHPTPHAGSTTHSSATKSSSTKPKKQ